MERPDIQGPNHPLWKGGRRTDSAGYVQLYAPDHRRGGRNNVREHVIVAECALGKALPQGAEVHHINGDRADNRPVNLVVCESHGYHALLHRRARALRLSGHAGWLRCEYCCKYDSSTRMTVLNKSGRKNGVRAYHKKCQRERYAERRETRNQ